MQNKHENNHIIFDGTKILLSPNITPVFRFLMEIEKEVETLLGLQSRLDDIRKQHLETLKLVITLSDKLKENNIDFNIKLDESPNAFAEKLNISLPLRSQFIVLFACLEVLYFFDLVYNEEIDNENQIRETAMKPKNSRNFIDSFILNIDNTYYKKHKERLSKTNAKSIRDLRNSLTHFFSLPSSGLSIMPDFLNEKARKLEQVLENNGHSNSIFLSTEDLYELIKSAHLLGIKKWNDDFNNDNGKFQRKIMFIISLVDRYGAKLVHDSQLNI